MLQPPNSFGEKHLAQTISVIFSFSQISGDLAHLLATSEVVSPLAQKRTTEPQPSSLKQSPTYSRPTPGGTLTSGLKLHLHKKGTSSSAKASKKSTQDDESTDTEAEDEAEIKKLQKVGRSELPKYNWGKEGLFVPVDKRDSHPPKPRFDQMGDIVLADYHKHESRGEGAHYLVAKLNGTNYNSRLHRFHRDDLKLQMQIAEFATSLSRGQRDDFAEIVAGIKSATQRRSVGETTPKKKPYTFPKLPETQQAARSMYGDSPRSFRNILPYPKAEVIGEHAYIPLSKIVDDFLANGVGMSSLCPNWDFSMDPQSERQDLTRRFNWLKVPQYRRIREEAIAAARVRRPWTYLAPMEALYVEQGSVNGEELPGHYRTKKRGGEYEVEYVPLDLMKKLENLPSDDYEKTMFGKSSPRKSLDHLAKQANLYDGDDFPRPKKFRRQRTRTGGTPSRTNPTAPANR